MHPIGIGVGVIYLASIFSHIKISIAIVMYTVINIVTNLNTIVIATVYDGSNNIAFL